MTAVAASVPAVHAAAGADTPPAHAGTLRAGSSGATYVALGDSYSAGEGLGPFEKGTDVDKGSGRNQCHRSVRGAYPVLRPAVVLPQVPGRAFFACSGATSKDMRSVPPQKGAGRQVGQPKQTATVGPSTQYVSLSAGGNDVGFGDLGQACVEGLISHKTTVGASTASCKNQLAASKKKLAATRASLIRLYTDLLARAPQATVVVLGYPRVFPVSYKGVPVLKGSAFCILDHYPLGVTVDIGLPVTQARQLDAFTVSLNATIQSAVTAVRQAHPTQQAQLRYADSYSSSVPRNCKGTTPNATVTALQLSLGHGLSGTRLKDKLEKELVASSTLHPTKAGQKMFATVVQRAFLTAPAALSTVFTRLSPVTDQGAVAPGFTVTQSSPTGGCLEGSEVGQAYRCFAGDGVFDPCYAVAQPGTGDGTGVVCVLSPFSTNLYAITKATGLGRLDANPFDEPNGVVLASGTQCRELQGAHGAATDGRIIDYGCDDNSTVILRDLHETGSLWIADIARTAADYSAVPAGSQPLASAVLLQHDVPPANRPVTDAGNATTGEFDARSRVHHEVDCGSEETTRNRSPVEQIFDSGTPCYEASLIVTEWDNGDPLDDGWVCDYDTAFTLLCEQASSLNLTDAPALFSSTHIRAITVG